MNTVIRRLDLRTVDSAHATYRQVVPRAEVDVSAAIESVAPICEDVRTRGDDAVLEYGQKFDGVRAGQLRVPPADIDRSEERRVGRERRARGRWQALQADQRI